MSAVCDEKLFADTSSSDDSDEEKTVEVPGQAGAKDEAKGDIHANSSPNRSTEGNGMRSSPRMRKRPTGFVTSGSPKIETKSDVARENHPSTEVLKPPQERDNYTHSDDMKDMFGTSSEDDGDGEGTGDSRSEMKSPPETKKVETRTGCEIAFGTSSIFSSSTVKKKEHDDDMEEMFGSSPETTEIDAMQSDGFDADDEKDEDRSSETPIAANTVIAKKRKAPASFVKPNTKKSTKSEPIIPKTGRTSITAADALAAARMRMKSQIPKKSSSRDESTSSNGITRDAMKPSRRVSSSHQKAALAIMQNMSKQKKSVSPVGGRPPATAKRRPSQLYPLVEPEHYWRNIRNWDFIRDFNEYMSSQKRSREESIKGGEAEEGNVKEETQDEIGLRPPLPDTFESHQQYKALWSPLLLEEIRSQIMSEVSGMASTLSTAGGLCALGYVHVKPLESPNNSSVSYNDVITLLIRAKSHEGFSMAAVRGHSGGRDALSFFANDVALLVPDASSILSAAQGGLCVGVPTSGIEKRHSTFSASGKQRLGILGHAMNRVRTVDGLRLKVSRKFWTAVGRPEMYLLRIGSNVTALREFSALCRVDSIPLMKYVMGKDLNGKTPAEGKPVNGNRNVLSNAGGESALGIGFRIYVKAKFNASQLGAITSAAREYGEGGFTLVKGPPGTGKTSTTVAVLNALHLRQYQRYYSKIERITTESDSLEYAEEIAALDAAAKVKPRILVCAPSNAAVDNVILKITEDRFVDGNGGKYSPTIVRVGVGQSTAVRSVSLKDTIDAVLSEGADVAKLESNITSCRMELKRLHKEIQKLRKRIRALSTAAPWPLSTDWEIRIDEETFDLSGRVLFVNHKHKTASADIPPKPKPGEATHGAAEMPHYRSNMDTLVKYVERHNSVTSKLEQYILVQNTASSLAEDGGKQSQATSELIQQLETHVLDSAHIVMTTLGSAGSRTVESAEKFEVVVVDEAAQSSEPATLVALQLGSSHAILVGDPQQLPATIFSVSGRSTKYDRSLFQRLEEAGHPVHMLDTQYRMHPSISEFPRRIFYDGRLLDGINVRNPNYGGLLSQKISERFPSFQPLTILDLDSQEEREGFSLSNSDEARLALQLYLTLEKETDGLSSQTRIAVITPYAQQVSLLRRTFLEKLGERAKVDISTVDAFQGKEANVVIFSCVRGAGRGVGIGFLSDVQRMNVALTRAKHFLFVIARCRTILVNPYWRDLVGHARERRAIIRVPVLGGKKKHFVQGKGKEGGRERVFPDLKTLQPLHPVSSLAASTHSTDGYVSDGEFSA